METIKKDMLNEKTQINETKPIVNKDIPCFISYWDDDRSAEEIIRDIEESRTNSTDPIDFD